MVIDFVWRRTPEPIRDELRHVLNGVISQLLSQGIGADGVMA